MAKNRLLLQPREEEAVLILRPMPERSAHPPMIPLDFEILSKLMRYVFTLLGVVIVLRSFGWLRKDRRATARRIKALPDAGTIGVLTVLRGSTELKEGQTLPVPPEGVLGFVRTCDIVVPVTDVVGQHLDFSFRNGKGLYIYPRRGCPVSVDGVTINSRADSRRYPMNHGSILAVGEALLQLGVFAGLDVKQAPGLWEEPEQAPAPQSLEAAQPYIPGPTPDAQYSMPGAQPVPPYAANNQAYPSAYPPQPGYPAPPYPTHQPASYGYPPPPVNQERRPEHEA